MEELPKTQEELQTLLDAKAQEVTENLTAKHNSDMAAMRKKHDSELAKAKEQANLTAEQIAEQRMREQQEQDAQELAELRQFKKVSVLSEKLKKEGLPEFFKNDTRLLNAEDGDVDKVIKDIKKDYEASQPKGVSHSSVVANPSGGNKDASNDRQEMFEQVGEALKQIVGK